MGKSWSENSSVTVSLTVDENVPEFCNLSLRRARSWWRRDPDDGGWGHQQAHQASPQEPQGEGTWLFFFILNQGDFFAFFLCAVFNTASSVAPSDSAVSEAAGIEPRTVVTSALAVRLYNHSARSHPHSARSHPHSARSPPLFFILAGDGKEYIEQKSQCWHFSLKKMFTLEFLCLFLLFLQCLVK